MKSLIILILFVGGAYAIYKAYTSSQEEAREARTVKALPPSVRHVVAQMDGPSQAAFFNEYEQKKKKKSIAWLMWFVFGWHYIYVGKIGTQFAYWFTFGGFGLWAIADLFRMPSIIQSANDQVARQALQTLQIGASFAGPLATLHNSEPRVLSLPSTHFARIIRA